MVKKGLLLNLSHTHPFNGPFSGTTWVSRYQKGKPIWILLKQETVSGSGISWAICKSAPRSRQITTSAPHHSVFLTGQMPCHVMRHHAGPTRWMDKSEWGVGKVWLYAPSPDKNIFFLLAVLAVADVRLTTCKYESPSVLLPHFWLSKCKLNIVLISLWGLMHKIYPTSRY